ALQAETARLDREQAAWEKGVDPKTQPKEIAILLVMPTNLRNAQHKQKIQAHHRSLSEKYRQLDTEVKALDARLQQVRVQSPVLKEGKARPTHVHIRGDFLDKGEAVVAALPTALLSGKQPEKVDRLSLARWLVDGNNPLTARV